MPVIMYNAKNTHTLQIGKGPDGQKPAKVRFLPGPNEISSDLWERLQEGSGCQTLLSQGKLQPLVQQRAPVKSKPKRVELDGGGEEEGEASPFPGPAKTEEVDGLDDIDISKMDAWNAKALIQTVVDIDMLKKYKKQEDTRGGKERKMVTKALEDQIKTMETPGSADGGQGDLDANAGRQV